MTTTNRLKIEEEANWLFSKLSENLNNENQRNYYQGRIDQLAWILSQLNAGAVLIQNEGV